MSARLDRSARTSGTWPPSRRYAGLCLAAAGVFLACAVTLWPTLGHRKLRVLAVEVLLVGLALAVALACRATAQRAPGYNATVWRLFSLTGLLWAAGRGMTTYAEQVWPRQPVARNVAELLLLAAVGTVAAALSVIPSEEREQPEQLRTWLGVAIIVGSTVLFCRSLVLANPPPPLSPRLLDRVFDVAYPTLHVALACLVWIVLLRVGSRARLPLFLVTAAVLVLTVANVYGAYYSLTRAGNSREVVDAGSACCYLLFGLAAVSPHAPNPRQPPARTAKARYVGFQSLIIYLPVMASAVVVCALPRQSDPVLIASGVLVLVLFGVRLLLLSVDNSRLRDDLESRVEALTERTSELRRLVLQNERIVQSVVDGVIGVDALGVVTFVNPAACTMLGYSREELLGKAEHEIFHGQQVGRGRRTEGSLGADEALLNCCVVATAMNTGAAAASDSEFVTASGTAFPVELAVGPIVEEGRITGAVVVFRDVSVRLEIEQMKNEFVSVVSHELRTPLTSIRGSLGLLAGGAAGRLTTQGERMVRVALESSERLTRLINDMLDIERIESGTIPVVLTDCDPADLITLAIDGLRVLVAGHQLRVRVAPGTALVRADADRVVQTLTNLVGNAVKFSPAGSTIDISAGNREQLVEFAVSDQGRGIPADKIGRIFERFEQVDSSDSREMGGTGLGLAISRTIVRRHGGEIWATSEPGQGSTFRFTLPAQDAAGLVLVPAGEQGVAR